VLAISLSWILYPWRSADATIRSLAVLPLENLSGDASQDYFVDGMTDELIAHPYVGDDLQERSQALGRDCP
jgi:hypothetical protein